MARSMQSCLPSAITGIDASEGLHPRSRSGLAGLGSSGFFWILLDSRSLFCVVLTLESRFRGLPSCSTEELCWSACQEAICYLITKTCLLHQELLDHADLTSPNSTMQQAGIRVPGCGACKKTHYLDWP